MKASEARKLTEVQQSYSDITYILEDIKLRASQGKSQIECFLLTQGQIKALVALEYKVEVFPKSIFISW